MTFSHEEYYIKYYDDKGKYHSTNYYQDINIAQEALEYYINNGAKSAEIVTFRY